MESRWSSNGGHKIFFKKNWRFLENIVRKLEAIRLRGQQCHYSGMLLISVSSGRLKMVHHLRVHLMKYYGLQWRTIWTPMITSNNAPFWSPEAMCNPKSVPWQCTLNERLKKVHHVWVYWMKVQGLHWRSSNEHP